MSNNNTQTSGGIGFGGMLTIAFIVLKLVGVIDWSWLWVLAPLWIGVGIVVVAFLVAWILTVIADRRS